MNEASSFFNEQMALSDLTVYKRLRLGYYNFELYIAAGKGALEVSHKKIKSFPNQVFNRTLD
jgi:hypothetical protein